MLKSHNFSATPRKTLAILADSVVCVLLATFLCVVWLNLGVGSVLFVAMSSWALAIPLLFAFGTYRSVFRYAGPSSWDSILKALAIYAGLFTAVLLVADIEGIPSVFAFFHAVTLFVVFFVIRTAMRAALNSETNRHQIEQKTVMIYGAGECGQALVQSLKNDKNIHISGFLDDDARLHGTLIDGVRVFDPKTILKKGYDANISNILLALPSVPQVRRHDIIENIRKANVGVRTVPSLSDIEHGKTDVSEIQELSTIDLLERSIVEPNPALMHDRIKGKIVCVTGAGGSIGSELCRQIIKQKPRSLIIVDNSEYALYQIDRELASVSHDCEIRAVLCNVRDLKHFTDVLLQNRPGILFHAAAYKHVPMVEDNPAEGLRNNVWGTLNVALASIEAKVESFVLISTDKAVRPTNVMGASKRLAEIVLQALDEETSSTTFSMVRFGNVLDSSGSVVPLFRKQIKDGGPITLTHTDVTRYFMTIPEAAQLVIQSLSLAKGGDVFVLDMGKPVKIYDLAKRMIELSGLKIKDAKNIEGDIEIKITGLRPGEKLYEELLIGDDPEATVHPKIMRAKDTGLTYESLISALERLEKGTETSAHQIKELLCELPLNYNPTPNSQ